MVILWSKWWHNDAWTFCWVCCFFFEVLIGTDLSIFSQRSNSKVTFHIADFWSLSSAKTSLKRPALYLLETVQDMILWKSFHWQIDIFVSCDYYRKLNDLIKSRERHRLRFNLHYVQLASTMKPGPIRLYLCCKFYDTFRSVSHTTIRLKLTWLNLGNLSRAGKSSLPKFFAQSCIHWHRSAPSGHIQMRQKYAFSWILAWDKIKKFL